MTQYITSGIASCFISLDVASLKPIAFALTVRALLSMLLLPFDDFLSSNEVVIFVAICLLSLTPTIQYHEARVLRQMCDVENYSDYIVNQYE